MTLLVLVSKYSCYSHWHNVLTTIRTLQEAAKTTGLPYGALSTSWLYAHGYAPIGPDGRVIDTPEVALAKAKHLAVSAQSAN